MSENIIDDDFCDLPDGSDEMHTPACSFFNKDGRFICNDGKKIFLSRVQDGMITMLSTIPYC